jgi:hypothetical protein
MHVLGAIALVFVAVVVVGAILGKRIGSLIAEVKADILAIKDELAKLHK